MLHKLTHHLFHILSLSFIFVSQPTQNPPSLNMHPNLFSKSLPLQTKKKKTNIKSFPNNENVISLFLLPCRIFKKKVCIWTVVIDSFLEMEFVFDINIPTSFISAAWSQIEFYSILLVNKKLIEFWICRILLHIILFEFKLVEGETLFVFLFVSFCVTLFKLNDLENIIRGADCWELNGFCFIFVVKWWSFSHK